MNYYVLMKNKDLNAISTITSYAKEKGIKYGKEIKTITLDELKDISPSSTIILQDIASLGNKFENIIETIKLLYSRKISIQSINDAISINENLSFSEILDLSVKIRKSLSSSINKSIQDNLKKEGKHRGRPFGALGKANKLYGKDDIIIESLRNSVPKSQIAQNLGVGRSSLFLYIRRHNLEGRV